MLSQSSHSINVAVSVNDCHRSVTVSEILRCKISVGAAVMTNENLECRPYMPMRTYAGFMRDQPHTQ